MKRLCTFKELHWLPPPEQNIFKVLLLIYQSLHDKGRISLNGTYLRYLSTPQTNSFLKGLKQNLQPLDTGLSEQQHQACGTFYPLTSNSVHLPCILNKSSTPTLLWLHTTVSPVLTVCCICNLMYVYCYNDVCFILYTPVNIQLVFGAI